MDGSEKSMPEHPAAGSLEDALTPRSADSFEVRMAKTSLGELLDPLKGLFSDDVTEVMINTHDNIWVEDGRGMRPVDAQLEQSALEAAIVALGRLSGMDAGENHPIVDARIGSLRIGALMPPVGAEGPSMCVRRHIPIQASLSMYGEAGVVAEKLLADGVNILVAGSTGSGKTTFVNALLQALPATDRMVVLEDTPELDVRAKNRVRMEARNGADMGALLRQTLRQRPDRIVLGEVRGREAYELLQAFNTGHGGSFSTVHASGTHGALLRLASLVGQADEARSWPQTAIRAAIAESVGAVVFLARKRVLEISRVCGTDGDYGFQLDPVFQQHTVAS